MMESVATEFIISDTIIVINEGPGVWYYWVKTDTGILTGKIYKDKETCVAAAKKLDKEKNG